MAVEGQLTNFYKKILEKQSLSAKSGAAKCSGIESSNATTKGVLKDCSNLSSVTVAGSSKFPLQEQDSTINDCKTNGDTVHGECGTDFRSKSSKSGSNTTEPLSSEVTTSSSTETFNKLPSDTSDDTKDYPVAVPLIEPEAKSTTSDLSNTNSDVVSEVADQKQDMDSQSQHNDSLRPKNSTKPPNESFSLPCEGNKTESSESEFKCNDLSNNVSNSNTEALEAENSDSESLTEPSVDPCTDTNHAVEKLSEDIKNEKCSKDISANDGTKQSDDSKEDKSKTSVLHFR